MESSAAQAKQNRRFKKMKRGMFLCVAVVCAAAIPAMGQAASGAKTGNKAGGAGQAAAASVAAPSTAGLKCTGADGATACTAAQVSDLNHGILVGRRMHQPLAMVQGVTQGSNGQLKCTQTNGSACTDAQLSAVIEVAGENQTKSTSGEIRIVREVDRATP
jgi:hypothetical protein